MMQRRLLRAALAAPFALLLALASAGQAFAAGPPTVLSLQVPAAAELGQDVEVIATLRTQAGEPVRGARVTFFTLARFGGIAGNMDLGSSVTDAEGTAIFRFAPRQTGSVTLEARFPGDAFSGAGEAAASLAVSGDAQLYIAEAGLRVPFFSVFLLAGALAVVFGLYTAVGLLIFGIAREGGRLAAPEAKRE